MLNTILKAIEYVVERMTFLLFVAMVIALFSQVVLRFFFDFSLSWTAEFSRFAMVWLVFLGASIGVKDGAHTQIDFFINRLPSTGKRCILIFNKVLCIGFLLVVSYYIIDALSYTMGTRSPAMRIPMGLMHMILPISGLLMITYLLVDIYRLVRNKPLFAETD